MNSPRPAGKAGIHLQPSRVLDRALRYWYVVVLSLFAGFGAAWMVNRYTTPVYPISASIIIRQSEDNLGAQFLYSNALVSPRRNYYDEFYIMRSVPLMLKVVQDLRLDVVFYRKGEIRDKEYFMPSFPVRVAPVSSPGLPYGRTFRYKILNEDRFEFDPLRDGNPDAASVWRYGDTVSVDGIRLVFAKEGQLGSKQLGMDYLVRFDDPLAVAERYVAMLNLSWSAQGSGVIDIGIRSSVPDRDIAFIQQFIRRYQEADVLKKSQVASRSIDFLDRQVTLIGDSLRYYEKLIGGLSPANMQPPEAQQARILSQNEKLDEQEIQTRLQERYYQYLEKYLTADSDFAQVLLPSSLGVADPVLSGLVTRLGELQFQLRLLKGQAFDAGNPLVQEAKEKVALYKRDIEEGIRSAKEIMRINRNLQKERLNELQSANAARGSEKRALTNLNRNFKLNEGLYTFLIQKRAEAAISQASTTSDIQLLNPPKRGGAIAPVPMRNYGIGMILGLLLPLAGFTFLELLNNKVQSKEDIERLCTVPVAGTIGHSDAGTRFAIFEQPRSLLAESFRGLRANLRFFTGGADKKVFLVTSTIPGEGKSFTSINLATILAYTGKRTVLIAADMRKPVLDAEFGATAKTGLSLVLSGQKEVSECMVNSKIPNLDFLASGPVPPNPAELLMDERMDRLFAELINRYDYVIVDSPPVGVVSDATALIPKVDHVLFVTRQNHTPLDALVQLQQLVDQGHLKYVSVILNDIRKVGRGYGYKYGYGYDYGYGSEDKRFGPRAGYGGEQEGRAV